MRSQVISAARATVHTNSEQPNNAKVVDLIHCNHGPSFFSLLAGSVPCSPAAEAVNLLRITIAHRTRHEIAPLRDFRPRSPPLRVIRVTPTDSKASPMSAMLQ